MRKALVFIAAFALVLVAGAAVAFMATPGDDVASESEAIEKATTTTVKEKESPPTTEKVKEEKSEDETPEEVKASTDKEDPPKEEEEKQEVVEKDTTAPKIDILFPENGQHFDERSIAFEGKVDDPTARVFAGKYEADVDGEGNWRIVLKLTHDGANHATFKAIDEAGNEATASVKAYYDAPEKEEKPAEEKPKEEPKDVGFSAHQKYGSCGDELPYDKWYGTGEPGTEIWIGSEYGSATTEIGKSGEWYLKVTFPEAPCNETFQVVLETNEGHRKVYEFTRICDEKSGDHGDK